MASNEVKINFSAPSAAYTVKIGHDLLAGCGNWARKCLGKDAVNIVVVSNPTIFKLYGRQVVESLASADFTVTHFLMKDGERYKDMRSTEAALRSFSEAGLSRTDAVVALGGGVVGDLAGFASAICLRGIPFLQIPTTLLAMIDSSVGGKTGVNSTAGKNLIGAFHQPQGVLIDTATLQTLPTRELTAGFCEAIKHGAISGKALFKQTNDFLADFPVENFADHQNNKNFRSEISNLISANVAFKASIVAGDERESSNRLDAKSRKILNFGHTLAHALEKVTDYKYLRHGEAVGYGILFAAELSKSLALIDEKDIKLFYDVVHRVGALPPLANIDSQEVFEAFRFDKKHLSGSLQMVLLKGIGKPVIRTQTDIPLSTIKSVLKKLLLKWA
ncbi:MAG TPA: 3-dehydroquinate synthase [Pyrinomonadaceae bacterium]|nr:3-dehydroquinate synthase [Pyrinomonadaceae bacterium]